MFILKHPNGKVVIGENYVSKSLVKAYPGSVQVNRVYYHPVNAAPTTMTDVTVYTSANSYSIESQTVAPGYSSGEYYDMYTDVYIKDDQVKLKISYLDKVYDESVEGYYKFEEKPLAVVFPTGSNSSLEGFELITRITSYADYTEDGGYLLNLEQVNKTAGANYETSPFANLYSNSGESVVIKVTSVTQTTWTADVEFDYLSNAVSNTINDIEDTVSDLSSESASKFVSR